jgi:predicted nucleic acid-binding protein
MAIMLDADVIIRGEKDSFDLRGWVSSQPGERFELAAITVAELWHGVERATGARQTMRRHYVEAIVASLPIIAYTGQTAYHHARIWAELQTTGSMLGYYDIIVAATAIERGNSVATFNARHFGKVAGLHVIEPI